MQTPEFVHAIRGLMELAAQRGQRVAIMCAEGNPFRCHRSLVACDASSRGIIDFDSQNNCPS